MLENHRKNYIYRKAKKAKVVTKKKGTSNAKRQKKTQKKQVTAAKVAQKTSLDNKSSQNTRIHLKKRK